MNRKQREAARQHYEAMQQRRKDAESRLAQLKLEKERQVQKALTKPEREVLPAVGDLDFWYTLKRKAPKLATEENVRVLAGMPHRRPISTWVPKGKSVASLFRSLAEYLLAVYPTPAIIWNALAFPDLVLHIAGGGSLFAYVKNGRFPTSLTRGMCHDLLKTPSSYSFIDAVRRVQVRAAGGDARLFNAIREVRYMQTFGTRESEIFWGNVIDWFARQPMLNPSQIGPICDYIAHCYREDRNYSLKGRTGLSVLRAMEVWHQEMYKTQTVNKGAKYMPSGFKPAIFDDYERSQNNVIIKEVWRVEELLTAADLLKEGKRMSHCVYSYGSFVERGEVSIWSVQMEDGLGETGNWAMLTLEVRNATRSIVQVRGRFNRVPTTKEMRVVTRWANLNGLQIASRATY